MTEPLTRLTQALSDRYRLERKLGEGGMATVYLAQDLKHDRKVAIKVLRPELAAVIGAERFLSEIKTTANLQHPNILQLHDSGEADSFLFYVMPFVEGESLRDRLTREKQLPIADAVSIATEVAGALDYAHRHNVIHRDIKPENILLHDSRALVADFGIALAASKAGGTRMTETGMSLGTPTYMSPEQAMGEREITARSDVYALGCVTYEMLVGEPPFSGPTAQAIVAKVMTAEPAGLTGQRRTIPSHVEAAVFTALEKLPADRFASAAEFAGALQGRGGAPAPRGRSTLGASPAAIGWRTRLKDPLVMLLAVGLVAAVAVAVRMAGRAEAPSLPPIQFVYAATDSTKPIDLVPWSAAISPDGGTLVYSVRQRVNGSILYVLRTDQLEARPIPGTTNATQPYFSPDGKWLGFENDGKERKVRLDGSAPVAITEGSSSNGADWTVGDEIVLGATGTIRGLSQVSASGGAPVELTRPDTARGEHDHLWPITLPDGKTIVFAIWAGSLATTRLAITSLNDGTVVPLGISGIRPLAVLDGMLIYVQADGSVMAVSLDAKRKKISGRPVPVHDPVPVIGANNGNSGIFISRGGAMVVARGGASGKLTWVSLDGRTEPVVAQSRSFAFPRLSPDGRRIAVLVGEDRKSDVWIYDLALGTLSRVTSAQTVTSVEWSADGSRILFTAAGKEARGGVWSQPASGGSPAEELFETPLLTPLATLSPDGRSFLVNSLQDKWGLFQVSLDSPRVARGYLTTAATIAAPRFSPDGKWVALESAESGNREVYVRSFPDPSSKIQVSVSGGAEPVWSTDGRRLYYRTGQQLLAARVTYSPTFTLLGRDTILGNTAFAGTDFFGANYDVTRDGKRFLAILPDRDDFQLVVSPNWITELRRRVAESRGAK
jgi:serine/threonine-protein kinase